LRLADAGAVDSGGIPDVVEATLVAIVSIALQTVAT